MCFKSVEAASTQHRSGNRHLITDKDKDKDKHLQNRRRRRILKADIILIHNRL